MKEIKRLYKVSGNDKYVEVGVGRKQ